jgi:hypothetical protein
MSQKSLSTRSLLELIDLFDRSSHAVARWRRSAPAWRARLGSVGPFGAVRPRSRGVDRPHRLCRQLSGSLCGDERVPVDLEEDDDPGRYRYRCPETFRTKVRRGRAGRRSCRRRREAAELLGGPARRSAGATNRHHGARYRWRAVAPRQDAHCRRSGRRLGRPGTLVIHRSGVSSISVLRPLPDQGLIFTTGQGLPDIVVPPRAYRIVPIARACTRRLHAIKPNIDIDLIHRHRCWPPGHQGGEVSAGSLRPVHQHAGHRHQVRQALGDQGPQAGRRGQPSVRAVRKRTAMGSRP